MQYTTTTTSKGQITIPKDFRDALNIEPGQKVSVSLEEKGNASILELRPIPRLEDLMGIFETKGVSYSKKAAREAYLSDVIAGKI